MTDWGDIDIDSGSDDNNDNNSDNGDGDGWDADDKNEAAVDVVDDWMNAPDPEEVARKKKEEEERIEREKLEAAEAEKQRKLKNKEEKEKKKKLKMIDNDGFDDDDGGLFDVELSNETKERLDFQNALDAMGDIGSETDDPTKVDIGRYVPTTAAALNTYKAAILLKVSKIFPEIENDQSAKGKKDAKEMKAQQDSNRVLLINALIISLADHHKAANIEELVTAMREFQNKRLQDKKGHKKKAKASTGKNFMLVQKDKGDDGGDDGFDDAF